MPGLSDSGHPDDIRIHLQRILGADDVRTKAQEDESERDALERTSACLSDRLRARVEASLENVSASAPGLSAAEVAKLEATRKGHKAFEAAEDALARVDSHLESVTGERNPDLGRNYGVFGQNPRSFAGVFRAVCQSVDEDMRIRELPECYRAS